MENEAVGRCGGQINANAMVRRHGGVATVAVRWSVAEAASRGWPARGQLQASGRHRR